MDLGLLETPPAGLYCSVGKMSKTLIDMTTVTWYSILGPKNVRSLRAADLGKGADTLKVDVMTQITLLMHAREFNYQVVCDVRDTLLVNFPTLYIMFIASWACARQVGFLLPAPSPGAR